jgi:hypothetical protein
VGDEDPERLHRARSELNLAGRGVRGTVVQYAYVGADRGTNGCADFSVDHHSAIASARTIAADNGDNHRGAGAVPGGENQRCHAARR